MPEKQYTDDEIRAMLATITPGEWIWNENRKFMNRFTDLLSTEEKPNGALVQVITREFDDSGWSMREQDAAFIAAAPTVVRQLLERVETAETAVFDIASGALEAIEEIANMLPRDEMQELHTKIGELAALLKLAKQIRTSK